MGKVSHVLLEQSLLYDKRYKSRRIRVEDSEYVTNENASRKATVLKKNFIKNTA
jgi:hypothetical protein